MLCLLPQKYVKQVNFLSRVEMCCIGRQTWFETCCLMNSWMFHYCTFYNGNGNKSLLNRDKIMTNSSWLVELLSCWRGWMLVFVLSKLNLTCSSWHLTEYVYRVNRFLSGLFRTISPSPTVIPGWLSAFNAHYPSVPAWKLSWFFSSFFPSATTCLVSVKHFQVS